MVKKKKAVSQALPPQNLLQPLSFLKVTKYMPMARKNMKIATFIALLHLLCDHNALNLTVTTTIYLLAAVTFMFLEALMANQFAIQYLLLNFNSYIDIECVSICGFVGIPH